MGSMVCNRIDLNGVGALRGQRHIPSKMGRGEGGGDTNVLLPTWALKLTESWGGPPNIGVACVEIA